MIFLGCYRNAVCLGVDIFAGRCALQALSGDAPGVLMVGNLVSFLKSMKMFPKPDGE